MLLGEMGFCGCKMREEVYLIVELEVIGVDIDYNPVLRLEFHSLVQWFSNFDLWHTKFANWSLNERFTVSHSMKGLRNCFSIQALQNLCPYRRVDHL